MGRYALFPFLVFERQPRWVPELERQFHQKGVRVLARSSIHRMTELIAEHPVCLAILVFDADPAGCLHFLERLNESAAQSVPIVIGSPSVRPFEWLVRELGAVEFITEPVPGDHVAAVCRRQLKIQPNSAERSAPKTPRRG